jgi:(p)ppGpp synthase/HD superfamily hydrolase
MPLVEKAFDFAREAHKGQKRKYTGGPYFDHPVEVAKIVKGVFHTEEMIAAALLHDVVEDCGVLLAEIEEKFGARVRYLVDMLSDPEKLPGNRAARKAQVRERWQTAPSAADDARTIKLADMISNSKTIVRFDPGFAKVYIPEMEALLPFLKGGDKTLYRVAEIQLRVAKEDLGL